MSVTNNKNLYQNNADLIVDLTVDINVAEEKVNEKISSVAETILFPDESDSDEHIENIEPLTGGE
jgi:hypothetical protein